MFCCTQISIRLITLEKTFRSTLAKVDLSIIFEYSLTRPTFLNLSSHIASSSSLCPSRILLQSFDFPRPLSPLYIYIYVNKSQYFPQTHQIGCTETNSVRKIDSSHFKNRLHHRPENSNENKRSKVQVSGRRNLCHSVFVAFWCTNFYSSAPRSFRDHFTTHCCNNKRYDKKNEPSKREKNRKAQRETFETDLKVVRIFPSPPPLPL